ncbi:hypothetical protein ACGF07_35330 [Kitasatospora sp. NPDC048194]|uniref:hypothetical protein n=1 Tax=Kitasatospora sp. NPDC048194 TaxID=3364045 RepID=UPI0037194406
MPVSKGRKKPGKHPARAAQLRRRLRESPLFASPPPFEGYEEWIIPGPDGRPVLQETAPQDTRDWAEHMALLSPLYGGRIPWAATQLDEMIRTKTLVRASATTPGEVETIGLHDFAEQAGLPDEDHHCHGDEDVCPGISCTDAGHDQAEHAVWLHFHHLHADGLIVVDERGAFHLSKPPTRPGDGWQLFDQPGIRLPGLVRSGRTTR